jgi:hypothetical protein
MFQNHAAMVSLLRSGHHAVAEWMMHLMPDPIEFIDDFWDKNFPERDQDELTIPPLEEAVKWYFWSFENARIKLVMDYLEPLEVPGRRLNVVVVRDFPNWLASYCKWFLRFKARAGTPQEDLGRRLGAGLAYTIPIWHNHADAALNPPEGVEPILYNKWFVSPRYRWRLARRLGLRYRKGGLDEIKSTWGGGSSFTRMAYHGMAQQMPVLTRWRLLKDEKWFRKVLLQNKMALEKSKDLFGEVFPGANG